MDAAIAANAVLGVVEPMSCGLGGDLFAIVWDARTKRLVGLNARIGALLGRPLEVGDGLPALVSIHPSAVLRAGDDREARRADLLEDLELAHDILEKRGIAA